MNITFLPLGGAKIAFNHQVGFKSIIKAEFQALHQAEFLAEHCALKQAEFLAEHCALKQAEFLAEHHAPKQAENPLDNKIVQN